MKLGRANVDQMLREMSFKQFKEWMVFSEIEPFDETRDDYRAASIVAAVMNAAPQGKKKRKVVKIEDAVLLFGDSTRQKRQQSWQEMKAIAMAFSIQDQLEKTPKTRKRTK